MQHNLHELDLESVRNLFLKETREYLAATQYEGAEELRKRKERIKEIETVLEEKKRSMQTSSQQTGF